MVNEQLVGYSIMFVIDPGDDPEACSKIAVGVPEST